MATRAHLSAEHLGSGRAKKHVGQQATGLGGSLGLMLTHDLLEDAGQAVPLALLSLEVALRPVMQQTTKPTQQMQACKAVAVQP